MTDLHRNKLLKALSEADRRLIADNGAYCEVPVGSRLWSPFENRKQVYFPLSGLLSITMDRDSSLTEVAIIGTDGFCGGHALCEGIVLPFTALVQISPLHAWSMPAELLRTLTIRSMTLQQALLRYTFDLLVQISETAYANARQMVEQRTARWLLLCCDRLERDSLDVTHDLLAMMVAAQRTGVTAAIHLLEEKGAIRSRRGTVIMRDRAVLEGIAGAGYSRPRAAFDYGVSAHPE